MTLWLYNGLYEARLEAAMKWKAPFGVLLLLTPLLGWIFSEKLKWSILECVDLDKHCSKRATTLSINKVPPIRNFTLRNMTEESIHDFSSPGNKCNDPSFLKEDYFQKSLKDKDGDGLCVLTVVDARFQDFAPVFAYSILATHPKSKAFVYFLNAVPKRLVNVMKSTGMEKTQWSFRQHPTLNKYKRQMGKSSSAAAARYFLRDADVERECQFIYYSDVDVFFTKLGNETLLSWHAKKLLKTQQPWYNVQRPLREQEKRCMNGRCPSISPRLEDWELPSNAGRKLQQSNS